MLVLASVVEVVEVVVEVVDVVGLVVDVPLVVGSTGVVEVRVVVASLDDTSVALDEPEPPLQATRPLKTTHMKGARR